MEADLRVPVRPDELVPPPRFASKTFASYDINPAIAGQGEAVRQVQAFAATRARRWLSRIGVRGKGLYLDGGFGVGKTHLLSACFHLAADTARFLSFTEAMSLMTMFGPRAAGEALAADLVCIDEFELDDPTNTRMADLLVADLLARGSRIITTSNTVPGELGQGRMAVDLFRAQLARLSESFINVHVPGTDHRVLHVRPGEEPIGFGPRAEPLSAPAPSISHAALDAQLTSIPVINLRRVAKHYAHGITITGVAPFTDQLSALRFVHLVDRLYDHLVPLRIIARCRIQELFDPAVCMSAFAKKYRRCESRLMELCG